MAASGRETIIKALKTCLEGITTTNGYAIEVKTVKRGMRAEADLEVRPALAINQQTIVQEIFSQGGYSEKTIMTTIAGWVDHDEDNFDNVDDLIQAVEQRLFTPAAWPYYGWTEITGIRISENGVQDMLSYFEIDVSIKDHHAWADP
jgi:hypothetical protein